jgi:hypothetical protein
MIECVLSSDDIRMYYIDGKHVSKEYMKLYVKKFNSKMPYCKAITENTKINRLKKKVKELKEKLSIMGNNISSKDYIDKSMSIHQLKDDFSVERINLIKNNEENNEKISELMSHENELKELVDNLKNENNIISDNFNTYKKNKEEELNDLKNKIMKLEFEINRVTRELEEQKKDTVNEDQKIKDLNYKLSESENIINNLKEDNSKLNQLNDEILSKNKNENEEIEIIKLKVKEYENSIEKLKVENKVLRGELDEVKLYNETEKKELSLILQKKEKELLDLKNEINKTIDDNSMLKTALNDALIINKEVKESEKQISSTVSLKSEEKLREEERLRTEEKLKEIESIKSDEKLREEERLKTEENLKEIERLRTEEKLKEIERLKTEEKLKEIERLKTEEKLKEEERLRTEEKLKEIEKLKTEEKLKEIERLRTEEKLKEIERLKTEEKLREIERLKTEEKIKEEKSIKSEEKIKEEESIKSEEKLKEEESIKSEEKLKEEERLKTEEKLSEGKPSVVGQTEELNVLKDEVDIAIGQVKKLGKDLNKDKSVKYEILEIEKISTEIKDQLNEIRRKNIDMFLESLGLDLDTYPIIFTIKHTKNKVAKTAKVIDVLLGLARSTLLNLKFFLRNPSILRIMSLSETDIMLDENTRDIISDIYYTTITDDLIGEDITELKNKARSRTLSKSKNVFITGLKVPLYEKFINELIKDSDKGTKRIKTETLLYYLIHILINISKLSEKELVQYDSVLSLIMNIIRNSIQKNENLIAVHNMIIQSKKDEVNSTHNNDLNIFTFLRLRSDDVNDANKRFNIKIDSEEKSIFIGYDSSTKKFYENNELVYKNIKYKDNYLFGPFTKIFKPYLSNKEIADDPTVQLLVKRLKSKKPVMIIGYGSSGSGKTSTLINFFDRNTKMNYPGVMIHMSNKMQDEYSKLKVSFVELEGNINSDTPVKDYKVLPLSKPHIYTDQKFIIKNSQWVIDDASINPLFNTDEIKKQNITVDSTTLLGNYIVQIMDNYRNIKATTNNPESSRSHMLIFVNFIKENGENVYLVVGDFAGVENMFDCLNNEVLNKFIEIRDKSNNRFYKDVLDKSIEDKLGDTLEVLEKSKKQSLTEADKTKFTGTKEKINLTLEGIKEIKRLFLSKNPGKQDGIKDTDKPGRIIAGPSDVEAFKQSKYRSIINMIFEKMYGKKIPEDYTSLNNAVVDSFKLNKDKITKLKLFENAINLENSKFINLETAENICVKRVKEGLFINDSLESLRMVISQTIKNKLNSNRVVPPFIDQCVSFQCNPYFEDCFGNTFETDDSRKSVIMDEIKNKICAKDECEVYNNLNIAVFNVLNISKGANNPPPIPYTDISGLMIELLRLKTLKSKIYDSGFDEDVINPILDEPYVRKVFLNDILNRETIKMYDKSAQDYITKIINILKEESYTIEQHINNLNVLITYINKINAVTSIGTMEFLDIIAKFGLNKMICNFQLYDDADFEPFIEDIDTEIKDTILLKLKEQRSLLLSMFENLFVQSYFK